MNRKISFYNECRGSFFRPGGFELTQRAVQYCGFQEGSTIADIGCGTGDSAKLLTEIFRINVLKVEPSLAMSSGNPDIINAPAEEIPLSGDSLDGALCECVLSLCDDAPTAFRELARIIKPSGLLVISDVYSKSVRFLSHGISKWFYTKDEFYDFLNSVGFDVVMFEDHSRELAKMAARLIMEGCEELEGYGDLEGCGAEKNAGYFLIIAKKI